MGNRLVIGASTAVAGATMMLGAGSLAPTSVAADQLSVFVCHATGDPAQPYVVVEAPYSSFDDEGESNHSLHSGDIIPPDVWVIPNGLNWTDENRAIWKNGCVVPAPTTTLDPTATTTTTEVDPTTTVTSTVTSTTAVASGGPTTTVRSATSVASGGPVTTAVDAQGTPLPRTGSSTSLLLFVGAATMLSGLLIVALSRRPA